MTPFLVVKLLQFVLRAAHVTSLSPARAQAEHCTARAATIVARAGGLASTPRRLKSHYILLMTKTRG